MRNFGLVIGLVLLAFATTGVSECDPGGGGGGGGTDGAGCSGNCKKEIHLNDKCKPVSADGSSMESVRIHPNEWVCFVNDTQCTFRLTFPSTLFGSEHREKTLKPGECVRLKVARQAARKTITYTIACDCPDVPGGGSGNPEFKVGGGSGGGGGGG